MPHTFSCTGCGACCKGRFVPLTLAEARAWLERGHPVALLLEAFDGASDMSPEAQKHARQRAVRVPCGEGEIDLIVILAAQALPRCPNLDASDRCRIYAERPLVCRIYPQEINPFIELVPAHKDCPDEAWQSGELIGSDSATRALIDASRQADRDDAATKVALCAAMGFTVSGWKGNGLTIYLPEPAQLLAAMRQPKAVRILRQWSVQVGDPALAQRLARRGLNLWHAEQPAHHLFHAA